MTLKKQFCKYGHDTFICGRGDDSRCKGCSSVAYKARYANPEVKVRMNVACATRNATPEGKAANKVTSRAWAATEEGKASLKSADLKFRCKKAGTTIEHYNSLPKKCSFPRCTAEVPGGSGDWHMDHNKLTGEFRGLLCAKHNRQVGDLTLGSATDVVEYLSRFLIGSTKFVLS